VIREIRLWPDPVLAQVCEPVGAVNQHVRALADDMLETMYAAKGRGLAAPQVGVPLRLFVMDCGWKEGDRAPQVMVNPEIVEASAERAAGLEGCLSIPGITAEVERAAEVTMRWTGLDGSLFAGRFSGFEAIAAQHERDHLDGIVTLDRVSPEVRARLETEYRACRSGPS